MAGSLPTAYCRACCAKTSRVRSKRWKGCAGAELASGRQFRWFTLSMLWGVDPQTLVGNRKFADSPLEEDGFEIPVPL